MKKAILALSLVVAILIGCTAGVVLHESLVPRALAQAQPAEFQYSVCTVVRMYAEQSSMDLNKGKPMDEGNMVVIPKGWNPIGGAGSGGLPHLVLCK